jgi:hypothetical protein
MEGFRPPSEKELMSMDLDRVHDELDRLGAPETRLTMCASDRLGFITGRLESLVAASNDYIAAVNCYHPDDCVGDHPGPARALSTIAQITWDHQEAMEGNPDDPT